jgi:hypothetical protein
MLQCGAHDSHQPDRRGTRHVQAAMPNDGSQGLRAPGALRERAALLPTKRCTLQARMHLVVYSCHGTTKAAASAGGTGGRTCKPCGCPAKASYGACCVVHPTLQACMITLPSVRCAASEITPTRGQCWEQRCTGTAACFEKMRSRWQQQRTVLQSRQQHCLLAW